MGGEEGADGDNREKTETSWNTAGQMPQPEALEYNSPDKCQVLCHKGKSQKRKKIKLPQIRQSPNMFPQVRGKQPKFLKLSINHMVGERRLILNLMQISLR